MLSIFNTVLDTLVRNVHYSVRIIICLAFFGLAAYFLMRSIRPKNHKQPIAWGWFTLCLFCMALSVLYVAI